MARFDWYQATVKAEPADVREVLRQLDACAAWKPSKKRAPHGYAFSESLEGPEGRLVSVWWGGMHARPHVVSTGEAAQSVSELLRAELPDHAVSRADACIDYADPGAYDRLQSAALVVARERRVKVGTAGDHLVTLRGRTCYLGAPSSHTRLRIYDKAEELRQQYAQDPVRLATVPAELARFECQVRPQTPAAKAAASRVDPITLMGSAAWMRELMRQVADLELHPFEAGKVWRQSDDSRAYAALLAQYGGLLKRMHADAGSWDCVGLQIGSDLAERARAKR